MDGDGELRLTIMATLAQEESRKVSERVKAGQHISRQNGTIYGCGNILGYDLHRNIDENGKWDPKENTYVINPEQAETVRMIYDMYLHSEWGASKIAQELTRLGRLNASGTNKWTVSSITRILSNQTYMGVMAYGKSYSNNYLEQRRIPNHNAETYMCVKANIEPIISEEEWNRCQEIKNSRIKPSLKKAIGNRKKNATHGTKPNHDLWGSRLQCSCGATFKKNRWHKNIGMPWSYGYQCYNQLNNGSAKKRREAGADDTGFCDMNMIADWKLDLMAKTLLEQLWTDRKEAVQQALELLRECNRAEHTKAPNLSGITTQIDKLKRKKSMLLEMRAEGEISKDEFMEEKSKVEQSLRQLTEEYEQKKKPIENSEAPQLVWDKIEAALDEMIDFSGEKLNEDIIRKFVSKIIPENKTHFRWYLNLDGNGETTEDVIVDGRKNHAVVTINGKGDPSPLHIGEIIRLNELEKDVKSEKYCLLPLLHRQPLGRGTLQKQLKLLALKT